MKASVQVQVRGFKALVRKLDTAAELKAFRDDILEPAMQTAQSTAQQHAPKDTGKLSSSLMTEIEPFSARMYTPIDKYPLVMEGGRKPGSKMPPPAALDQWARRYGIQNTFLLARAIAKRGIRGRFFRRKARVAVRKELPSLMANMARTMEKDWGKTVSDA